MKRINLIVILFTSILLLSCSEDVMQDINKNVNNPTNVASKLIVTDVINNTSFNVTGADLALYASVYVEYNVGIWNQMYNAEIRTGEPSSSTTYNNTWGSIYNNLLNLRTIINKCSPDGDEPDNNVTLGIAQVLSAYNLAILTDMFGDVPWNEALQPGIVWAPALDKQEKVYEEINKFLTEGIANLEKPSTIAALGTQDPIFAGKAASWIKFAYGLKARYTMRLSKVKPDYDGVIAAAGKSFTKSSEEAKFKTGTIKNPFYKFFTDRDYFGASQSLHEKLIARSDPRDGKYFKAYPGVSSLEFAPNGKPDQVQGKYGISALSIATAPIYLMSYHELEFLLAEAYARKGGASLTSAKDHLKKAIEASFLKSGLTAADATAYYTATVEPKLTSDAEALKEIMIQKYIGLYEGESLETYNDIRRLRAMGHSDFIQLSNTLKFPVRYTYGADDVTTNSNVRNAYGDGQYVYSENVWWAGGTR